MANLEEKLIRDNKIRTQRGVKSSQEFLNVALSDTGMASFSISNGGGITITFTLLSQLGLTMFGFEENDFYLDSVNADNSIPDGTNVDPADWRTDRWNSWGETDNKNIAHKDFIYNESGSTQDVVWRGQFRYLVERSETQ